MVEQKRFKKKCPYCNINIASPWKSQLDWNYDMHVVACKKRAKIRKEKDKAREKKKLEKSRS